LCCGSLSQNQEGKKKAIRRCPNYYGNGIKHRALKGNWKGKKWDLRLAEAEGGDNQAKKASHQKTTLKESVEGWIKPGRGHHIPTSEGKGRKRLGRKECQEPGGWSIEMRRA